ncbi:MAG TPA: diguanylate cyclase [Burkholderiaceae bacterium]
MRRTIIGLVICLVSLVLIGMGLAWLAQRSAGLIERQNQLNRVLPALNGLNISLLNAETGQRGYLLTGSRDYLQPYLTASAEAQHHLDGLQEMEREGLLAFDFSRLHELVARKFVELKKTIELQDAGDHGAALDLVGQGQGKQIMDELRGLIDSQVARFRDERSRGAVALAQDARTTKNLMLAGVVSLSVLATAALALLVHHARQVTAAYWRVRRIADQVPVLITQFDLERRIIFANEFACTTYGLSSVAMLGKRVEDIRGHDAATLMAQHMDAVLAGQDVEFDSHAIIKGRSMHFRQRYVPDRHPAGTILGFVAVSTDVSSLKEAEERLETLTRTDVLTGLPNRREFQDRLKQAMARSERDRKPFALLFLDVDRFKDINDTMGHAVGDAVLIEFGRRLQTCIRATDTVARLAGDEFVAIVEALNSEQDAVMVGEKILQAMQTPMAISGCTAQVGTSIGIAIREPGGPTQDGLMEAADQALYKAKRSGRGMLAT